jgi:uncharacterized coiled-coil protein SlyX
MNYQTVGIVLAALFFIAGGLATLYKFVTMVRKEREEENQKILKDSKAYVDMRMDHIQQELNHQKDMHEGKISELSQKIDELKDEMSRHHSQLMDLLVKKLSE